MKASTPTGGAALNYEYIRKNATRLSKGETMIRRLAAAAVVVSTLVGCASAPKQTFNAEANQDLKTIAVLTPPRPPEVSVAILNHPGMQFGLIGGLVAAAEMSAKTSSYNSAIAGQQPNWSAYASEAMKKELTALGYTVVDQPVERKPGSDLLDSYPTSDADAYLDFKFNISYVASTPTSDYVPGVTLNARLVERKTKSVLYEEQYSYGHSNPYLKTVHLASDGKYRYANMEALKTRGAESLAGLTTGLDHIARRIAQHLQPKHAAQALASQ